MTWRGGNCLAWRCPTLPGATPGNAGRREEPLTPHHASMPPTDCRRDPLPNRDDARSGGDADPPIAGLLGAADPQKAPRRRTGRASSSARVRGETLATEVPTLRDTVRITASGPPAASGWHDVSDVAFR